MPWYDAINQFVRRDYPGSYKQSAAGPLKSDRILGSYKPNTYPSTARSITQMPYKPKSQVTRTGRGRTTSGGGKRAPARKSTKKRKLRAKGSFKKPKKVRKVSTKFHNHRYEQEGTCNAGQPYMYVAINDCHKKAAIWDAMADALLRPILAKEFKFRPLQDTDVFPNVNASEPRTLYFDFKRVNGVSGSVQVKNATDSDVILALNRLDCDDLTYETLRTRMSEILQYWADGSTTVAPSSDSVAYYPYRYHVSSSQSTTASTAATSLTKSFEHLADTMIEMKFTQRTMFVNRTPAEGGGTNGAFTDRLGTNPLKGMLYQFNHAAPRILDHVDMTDALRTSIQSDPVDGIDKYTSVSAADILTNAHLAHPLSAKFWLKNCSKQTTISMQPGQTKDHRTVHIIKGRISTLIERFYFAGYDKGSFGSSSLFMFDMVHKSDQTPTTTYKRSALVQSYGRLVTPKLYIRDFEVATVDL
jgi:hypothetical protein